MRSPYTGCPENPTEPTEPTDAGRPAEPADRPRQQRPGRAACHPGGVLKLLRARRDGRPTVRARVVAVLIVLGMVAITAPILAAPVLATLHWLLALL
jgi:hypothetical protein